MNKVALIFPNQLFQGSELLDESSDIYLWESNLHFTQYKFHKKKLILHRASMKFYEEHLKNSFKVKYLEFREYPKLEMLFKFLCEENIAEINIYEPIDYLLNRRLQRYSEQYEIGLNLFINPNFVNDDQINESLLKSKKHFLTKYYISQRQRLDIIIDGNSPVGGKWSFDTDNRKKLPKGHKPPAEYKVSINKFIKEAKEYVDHNFQNNPGNVEEFNYPIDFDSAEKSFIYFLEKKMNLFGDFEDAISDTEDYIYHSILTPALNIGLINPHKIIDLTLEYHIKYNFPLNSLEGFIRQVIGWREFMRAVYIKEGVKIRTSNYWDFNKKMPDAFYSGNTGIYPVDNTIKKLSFSAYNHHIERLMVLGNFMLLCEIHPEEIYKWFMELYIDSYDWVMVPNVYSMSQYADGGLITTKPYISGSNYIRKMSDYRKGDWCEIWDSLYWRFIHKYQLKFSKNPRMSMMINLANKKTPDQIDKIYEIADKYLENLK